VSITNIKRFLTSSPDEVDDVDTDADVLSSVSTNISTDNVWGDVATKKAGSETNFFLIVSFGKVCHKNYGKNAASSLATLSDTTQVG